MTWLLAFLLPLADLQTAAARDLFGRRGHRDLEHAVLEAGLRLIRHDAVRKRDRAVEAAVAALGSIESLAFFLLLALALALDDEAVVGHIHLDIVFVEA